MLRLFLGAISAFGFVFWWGVETGWLSVLNTTHGTQYWLLLGLFGLGYFMYWFITGIIAVLILLESPPKIWLPYVALATVAMLYIYSASHKNLLVLHWEWALALLKTIGLSGAAYLLLVVIWEKHFDLPPEAEADDN